MKDENGRLYRLLSEKDFEIRNLKKKREEDEAGNLAEPKVWGPGKSLRLVWGPCESLRLKLWDLVNL